MGNRVGTSKTIRFNVRFRTKADIEDFCPLRGGKMRYFDYEVGIPTEKIFNNF